MKVNSLIGQTLVFILSLFFSLQSVHGYRTLRDELLGNLVKVDEYKQNKYFKVQSNMFNIQTAIFQSQSLINILESQFVKQNPIKVIFPPVDIYTWIKIMKNENNNYPRNKFPERILYGEDPSCKNTISYKCYKACLICSGQYFVTQNKITQNLGNEEEFKLDDGSTFYGYKLGSLNTQFQDSQIKVYFELLQCNNPNITYDKSNNSDIIQELFNTMNSINLSDDKQFDFRCVCSGIKFCNKCENFYDRCVSCHPSTYFLALEGKCLERTVPNCSTYYQDDDFPQGCSQCIEGFIKIGDECVEGNTCPNGQYLINDICCKLGYGSIEGRTCQECFPNCQKCSSFFITNSLYCNECKDSYIVNKIFGSCQYCEVETYNNQKYCKNCQLERCKYCSGLDPSECEYCTDGFILKTGQSGRKFCILCTEDMQCSKTNSCQLGEFRNQQDPYDCLKCQKGCQQCFGYKSCQSCLAGYVLHSGICQKVEYNSQYLDPLTQQQKCNAFASFLHFILFYFLQSCNFTCSKCSDNTNLCDSCSSNFSYYIEKNQKKVCFQKCPLYFYPSANNPKLCELQSNLSTELQNIAKSQIDFSRNNMPQNIRENTQNCPPKCEQCTSSGCILCTQGYFWYSQFNKCQKCHESCFSCKGPTQQDCTSCSSFSVTLPFGQYGPCISASSQKNPILSSQDILKDQDGCINSYKTTQGYQIMLNNIYSYNDPLWSDVQISKNCQFDQFKQLYPYIKNNNYSCKNEEIANIKDNGQLIFLLATILSSQQLKLNGIDVNPQNLIDKAIKDMALTIKNLFKPGITFECSQLRCSHSINVSKLNFEWDSTTNLKINKYKEITFKTNDEPLTCDSSVENKQIDLKYLNEFEDLVTNSFQQTSPGSIFYFILNVCGLIGSETQKKPIVYPVLITKQLGQGFYQFVHPSINQQTFTLFISGASSKENEILKNCYSSYKSPFVFYKVKSVKVFEVRKQGRYQSFHESQLSKIKFQIENPSTINNTSTICKCGRPHDFIILNDRRGGIFDQNDNSNNILTPYIKKKDMIKVLSTFGVNDIQISKYSTFTQQRLFEMYVDNLILNVKQCYPIENLTQCVQNVLIDIAYSSFGQCLNDIDTQNIITLQKPITQLQTSIQKSEWCQNNKYRCQKNIETLQLCI